MKHVYSFLISFSLVAMVFSQNLTRGPYMQSPNQSSIYINWRTNIAATSKVWYGLTPTTLNDSVLFNGSITEHSLQITGLAPYTKYYYAIGYGNTVLSGADSSHYFITAPLPYTEQLIRVWATGDFGKGNQNQVNTKQAFENYTRNQNIDPDIWIWLGDNAYQDGTQSNYQNNVFDLVGYNDIFSWLPFWPSPGNHDYNTIWSDNGLLGVPYTLNSVSDHDGPYYDIINVPENAEMGGVASNSELYYSFDYGNVHFLSLNSEVYEISGSGMLNQMKTWVQNDLAQNDKDWTIAYWHQPPYSKGSHDSDDFYERVMKEMREDLIPLLEQFDIDMVICGHSHVYERSYLMHGHYDVSNTFNSSMVMDYSDGNKAAGNPYIKNTFSTSPQGTIYTVVGNSGSDNDDGSMDYPAMVSNLNGNDVCGSLVLDIYKNEIHAKYLTATGTIYDDYSIIKQNMIIDAGSDVSICQHDTATLSISQTKGSDSISYNWMPGNMSTASIQVSPSSTTYYYATVTDLLSGQVAHDTVLVTVSPFPSSVSISENNGTLETLTGYSYQWYKDGNSINGANNATYSPNSYGSYSVTVSNAQGCSITSSLYHYYDLEIEAVATQQEICKGDSLIINILSNGGSDSTEVFWLTPSGSPINAFYSPNSSENIIAQGNDYLTGEQETDTVSISVYAAPDTPIISLQNQTLSTVYNSDLNYTWYLNGNVINGNYSNELQITENGNYIVEVTDANGCKSHSELFNVSSVGIKQTNIGSPITIFPNPNKGSFTIKTNEKITYVRVINQKGQQVFHSNENLKNISLSNLANGTYTIEIKTIKNMYKQSFIVQK